jgi:hypothetical protein
MHGSVSAAGRKSQGTNPAHVDATAESLVVAQIVSERELDDTARSEQLDGFLGGGDVRPAVRRCTIDEIVVEPDAQRRHVA